MRVRVDICCYLGLQKIWQFWDIWTSWFEFYFPSHFHFQYHYSIFLVEIPNLLYLLSALKFSIEMAYSTCFDTNSLSTGFRCFTKCLMLALFVFLILFVLCKLVLGCSYKVLLDIGWDVLKLDKDYNTLIPLSIWNSNKDTMKYEKITGHKYLTIKVEFYPQVTNSIIYKQLWCTWGWQIIEVLRFIAFLDKCIVYTWQLTSYEGHSLIQG